MFSHLTQAPNQLLASLRENTLPAPLAQLDRAVAF